MSALRNSKKLLTVGLSALALTSINIGVSHAGFQWTAPAQTYSAPAPTPMPAVPAPAIQSAPIPAPTFAPAPAPAPMAEPVYTPAVPNVVFDPMPSASPMPGSTVLPQESRYGAAPEPLPTPMPTPVMAAPAPMPVPEAPAPIMGVETGPSASATPRRIRPSMAPQPILPSNANIYPAPAEATIGDLPRNNLDFVPTYNGPAPVSMTPESIMTGTPEPIYNPAPAAVLPSGPAVPAPAPIIEMPAPAVPMTQGARAADLAPIIQTNAVRMPQYTPPAPMVNTSAMPNMIETPAPGQGYIFENAVGFGKDLPMMTAVKQIIPQDYGLSFAAGVPTNANVSWEGGRPWNEVLDLALAPHGLQAVINGNIVNIIPIGSAAPIMPQYVPSSYESAPAYEQKSVIMAPILDDSMAPTAPQDLYSQQIAPSPTNILTPAVATSDMGYNDYYTPAAASPYGVPGMPATQPMIGSMAPDASPYPPVSPTNPQIYDKSIQFWAAPKDSSLREVLSSWTRKAGVELFWASEYDYPISAAINIEGNFEEAVQTLLKGLEESEPRPQGRLHPNLPNGPAVLVIETRGIN